MVGLVGNRLEAGLRGSMPISLIHTAAPGEQAAASAISAQLPDRDGFTALFCTSQYDLGHLGEALCAAGHDHVVAAATSRAIGPAGILKEGISGFHLPAGRFKVADVLIDRVAGFHLPDAREVVHALLRCLSEANESEWPHRFAMLFVDAEPRCEERLVAALGTELGGVPLIGGSAGDLYFNPLRQGVSSTRVLHRGRAVRGGAVFSIIASRDPVLAQCHHHYVPGNRRLVVTDADPERRVVREFDGRSALSVYAAACGFRSVPKDVGPFASHPLMVKVGGQYYVRGMQRILEDGALEFACAIEPGLVVTVARPVDMLTRLAGTFEAMQETLAATELIIGFDCATRTAYMEQNGLTNAVSTLFEKHRVVGFSTLGEQFNTMHMNNSFTCLGVAVSK